MKTAAVKLDDELPVPRPEPEDHKEQAISIVLPRTQRTEWFERGEAEAKEAHARHAREIAEAREAPRRPGPPGAAASTSPASWDYKNGADQQNGRYHQRHDRRHGDA